MPVLQSPAVVISRRAGSMSRINKYVLPITMLAVAIAALLIDGAQFFVDLHDRNEQSVSAVPQQERPAYKCPTQIKLCGITASEDVVVTGNVNAHSVHSQRGSVILKSRD